MQRNFLGEHRKPSLLCRVDQVLRQARQQFRRIDRGGFAAESFPQAFLKAGGARGGQIEEQALDGPNDAFRRRDLIVVRLAQIGKLDLAKLREIIAHGGIGGEQQAHECADLAVGRFGPLANGGAVASQRVEVESGHGEDGNSFVARDRFALDLVGMAGAAVGFEALHRHHAADRTDHMAGRAFAGNRLGVRLGEMKPVVRRMIENHPGAAVVGIGFEFRVPLGQRRKLLKMTILADRVANRAQVGLNAAMLLMAGGAGEFENRTRARSQSDRGGHAGERLHAQGLRANSLAGRRQLRRGTAMGRQRMFPERVAGQASARRDARINRGHRRVQPSHGTVADLPVATVAIGNRRVFEGEWAGFDQPARARAAGEYREEPDQDNHEHRRGSAAPCAQIADRNARRDGATACTVGQRTVRALASRLSGARAFPADTRSRRLAFERGAAAATPIGPGMAGVSVGGVTADPALGRPLIRARTRIEGLQRIHGDQIRPKA